MAEIELPRAIRTVAPEGLSAPPSVLARLDRFDIDPVIRSTSAAYRHPALRSLDAVHLATAQVAASTAPLTALVTYNGRLSDAAVALGIPTVAPGKAVMKPAGEGTREVQSVGGNVMSNSTPAAELAELARDAAWGLAKGGDLDSLDDGKAALVGRLDILEAAERAGIHIDLDGSRYWHDLHPRGDRQPSVTTLVVPDNATVSSARLPYSEVETLDDMHGRD